MKQFNQEFSTFPWLLWALLYSLHTVLHFFRSSVLGLNLWQGIKLVGLFILIVIMALSDVSRSKLDRKSDVLFFLIIEKTRSSAALLCGIVRTDNITLLRFGSLSLRYPQIISIPSCPCCIDFFSWNQRKHSFSARCCRVAPIWCNMQRLYYRTPWHHHKICQYSKDWCLLHPKDFWFFPWLLCQLTTTAVFLNITNM